MCRQASAKIRLQHELSWQSNLCLICASTFNLNLGGIDNFGIVSSLWITVVTMLMMTMSLLISVFATSQASIVLQLCCTTSWTHIKLLGQLLEDDTVSVEGGDLSKSMIKDAAVDACSKSAVAFDVIHKCGNSNLQDLVVDCLLNWSLIEDLLELSTSPSVMVKQWVKVQIYEII